MIKNEQERMRMGERIATLRKSIDWTDDRGIHRHGMTQAELAADMEPPSTCSASSPKH